MIPYAEVAEGLVQVASLQRTSESASPYASPRTHP